MQSQDTSNAWGTAGNAATPRPAKRKALRAKLTTVRDVQGQLARLYREARSGTIPVEHASRLANVLAILGRMIADSDLEARIAALEAESAK